MRKPGWTDQQLGEAVPTCFSIAGVMRILGLKPGGGTHAVVKRRIAALGLDTSHFTGQGWNQGNWAGNLRTEGRPLAEILVEDSDYRCTTHLKKRLLDEGMLEERCYACDLPPVWLGERLVLRIDHINGNRTDNRLENLRLLCPNCDSQMPTFNGRNKGRVS